MQHSDAGKMSRVARDRLLDHQTRFTLPAVGDWYCRPSPGRSGLAHGVCNGVLLASREKVLQYQHCHLLKGVVHIDRRTCTALSTAWCRAQGGGGGGGGGSAGRRRPAVSSNVSSYPFAGFWPRSVCGQKRLSMWSSHTAAVGSSPRVF